MVVNYSIDFSKGNGHRDPSTTWFTPLELAATGGQERFYGTNFAELRKVSDEKMAAWTSVKGWSVHQISTI